MPSAPYAVCVHNPLMDTQQLHQNFLEDFIELLRKYSAEFDLSEGDPTIFFFSSKDENGTRIRSYSTYILPNSVYPQ